MESGIFINFANRIGLKSDYSDEINLSILQNPEINSLLDKLEDEAREHLFHSLDDYNRLIDEHFAQNIRMMINLYYSVVFARRCESLYISKGIRPEIFIDTMGDINIWADNFYNNSGAAGIEKMGWIKKHLMFKIFKLGRLQFEVSRLSSRIKDYPEGTECLNIHIPRGEKLDTEKCRDSLAMAEKFFLRHFSKTYDISVCNSWLLNENLRDVLDENSNILRFAGLFEIVSNNDDCTQAIERVFGTKSEISVELPEMTTLQRELKHYLLSGHKVGMGLGIIERRNII